MAHHKEAMIRYRIINECLRNRKTVSIDELIDACKDRDIRVSERTIREDIRNMRLDSSLGFDAPIESIRPKKYRYSDPDYSINKLPLSNYELESLVFASKLLEQFSNMVPLDQIPGAIQKIFNHLKIRRDLSEEEFSEMIDFEKAPETKGIHFIEPLLSAIRKKQVVEIIYKRFFDNNEHLRIVHPYLLKEYLNRWYLLGYSEEAKELHVYGLDRIISVKIAYGVAYKPIKGRPKDYFRNLIGVTKFSDTIPEKILLKFTKQQTPYVLTQPLHVSQKIVKQTDTYTIISLLVHHSPELQMKILSWHNEVEVLAPESLRNSIIKMIEGAAKVYGIV